MGPQAQPKEIGYASAISDYLVSVNGLPEVRINEIVVTESKARGIVTALKDDSVTVLMLDPISVRPNEVFSRTYKTFSVRVGSHFLGRAINPLGVAIDGKQKFPPIGDELAVDQPIRGIKTRLTIKNQFETGIMMADMLVPIAKGQRELLIGNAKSGRTSFLIDLIVNQKDKGIICIYTMVGKPVKEIKQLVDILEVNKALPYTIIVAAASSDLASLIYLGPSVGITLAEYFQRQGKDVLLVLDDMGSQAKFYREISLLGNKFPGRESYPGDIFFQHARIMERAGSFNKENGGGSITCLPVIEVNLDDFSAYIPTNLMAMTDGHLRFDSALYRQGTRPAVDISLSVSRVGKQTQTLPQKMLADRVRSTLAEAEKVETLSRFGSEISSQTQLLLRQSEQIKLLLIQSALVHLPQAVQMVILSLAFTPFFQTKDTNFVRVNKQRIIDYLRNPEILTQLEKRIEGFKDDLSLIEFVKSITPNLEAICQQA